MIGASAFCDRRVDVGQATLFQADALDMALYLPSDVDLTVTSPPYNLDIDYGAYDDGMAYGDYLAWVHIWARELFHCTTRGGRAAINVPLDTNKGGKRAVYADYVRIFQAVGWSYQTSIVWNEQNISRRTAWGSYGRPSAPFATAPVEMIAVFYRGEWKRPPNGRTWDIDPADFRRWTLGHWTFPGVTKRKSGHPAAFPEELPRRLIQLYSYCEDTIFDPFSGSATTMAAASRLGRRSIGIEIGPAHFDTGIRNLEALTV